MLEPLAIPFPFLDTNKVSHATCSGQKCTQIKVASLGLGPIDVTLLFD